jgi:hypothetical protein
MPEQVWHDGSGLLVAKCRWPTEVRREDDSPHYSSERDNQMTRPATSISFAGRGAIGG